MKLRLLAAALAALALSAGVAEAARHEVVASARVSPGPHLFGDRVSVVVEAVVDQRRADPDSVRAEVHLAPYEAFGAPRKKITTEGRFARVTFTYPVACLSIDCIPEAGKTIPTEKRVTFPPARVDYRDAKKKRHTLSVVVPPVRLVARAVPRNQSGAQTFFRDPIEDLRAPARTLHTSYWTSPTLLGALLVGAGALALALAGLLLVPAARRVQEALRPVAQGSSTTPLEDAIALVERTSAEQPGSTEHREALARLVRELRAAGLDELAEPARRLAWSADSPTRDHSSELTTRVRQAVVAHA
jgi:hypothetical protein